MSEQWKPWVVVDYTKKTGGYLMLTFNGRRVADFFPFAKNADELWVREQAELIASTMNAAIAKAESA